MYRIEVVWNRDFDWRYHTSKDDKQSTIDYAKALANSGDGARIKKIRVINNETDEVVYRG